MNFCVCGEEVDNALDGGLGAAAEVHRVTIFDALGVDDAGEDAVLSQAISFVFLWDVYRYCEHDNSHWLYTF
jgi:hypothetical protein